MSTNFEVILNYICGYFIAYIDRSFWVILNDITCQTMNNSDVVIRSIHL